MMTSPQYPNWGSNGQQNGQFDGGPGGYPGYPGGPPAKSKTGLIIGLVALAVLIVGGIVTLIIVLTSKSETEPVSANSSTKAPTKTSNPSASSPPAGDQSTPQALAEFIANAYRTANGHQLGTAFCRANPQDPIVDNAIDPGLLATISSPVSDLGVQITLNKADGSDSGQIDNRVFTFQHQNGIWCWSAVQKFDN